MTTLSLSAVQRNVSLLLEEEGQCVWNGGSDSLNAFYDRCKGVIARTGLTIVHLSKGDRSFLPIERKWGLFCNLRVPQAAAAAGPEEIQDPGIKECLTEIQEMVAQRIGSMLNLILEAIDRAGLRRGDLIPVLEELQRMGSLEIKSKKVITGMAHAIRSPNRWPQTYITHDRGGKIHIHTFGSEREYQRKLARIEVERAMQIGRQRGKSLTPMAPAAW